MCCFLSKRGEEHNRTQNFKHQLRNRFANKYKSKINKNSLAVGAGINKLKIFLRDNAGYFS